jgi:hypothetical protein
MNEPGPIPAGPQACADRFFGMPRSRCGSTSTSALVEQKELLAIALDDSCTEFHRGHPQPASRLEASTLSQLLVGHLPRRHADVDVPVYGQLRREAVDAVAQYVQDHLAGLFAHWQLVSITRRRSVGAV